METAIDIKYNYKLKDFEVVQRNILTDYNIHSTQVLGNGHYKAGYEIYKINKFLWFKSRDFAPEVRLETIEEVNDWLLIETGEHFIKDNK